MNITIKINTDNDAFAQNMNTETAVILRKLVAKLERDEVDVHPGETAVLMDSCGNRVGEFKVTR